VGDHTVPPSGFAPPELLEPPELEPLLELELLPELDELLAPELEPLPPDPPNPLDAPDPLDPDPLDPPDPLELPELATPELEPLPAAESRKLRDASDPLSIAFESPEGLWDASAPPQPSEVTKHAKERAQTRVSSGVIPGDRSQTTYRQVAK
jgi:hypothetical protein